MRRIIRWLKAAGLWCTVLSVLGLGAALLIAPDWTWNILMSLDQVGNALLLGDPGETISSRLGKWLTAETDSLRRFTASAVCWVLDLADADHCLESVNPSVGGRAILE